MAEQIVKLDTSSPEEVAYKVWIMLRAKYPNERASVDSELKLYARCLRATFGKTDNPS